MPAHVARAYGFTGPGRVQARPGDTPDCLADRRRDVVEFSRQTTAASQSAPLDLVAAKVERSVEFSEQPGVTTRAPGASLPFYRHPADVNAAATGVLAGRSLDVTG